MVTFISRSLGRGTDFKCCDNEVNKEGEGGLHLIITFLSKSISEDI